MTTAADPYISPADLPLVDVVPDALERLVREAHAERRALAHRILAAVAGRLPHYRGLSSDMLADVEAKILHHLELFYWVTLRTGRIVTDADVEVSCATARSRAAQGVPFNEFLMFFNLGMGMIWDDVMDRVGDDLELRAVLLDRTSAVITNQQKTITAVTEAYFEESERLSRFREIDLDEFFRLLFSDEAVLSVLESRAHALGIDLSVPHNVAVLQIKASPSDEPGAWTPEHVTRSLSALSPALTPWVGRCREGFAILSSALPNTKELEALAQAIAGPDGRVGVGETATGGAIHTSARYARRALELGALLFPGVRVVRYADVAVADLIDLDSPVAADFAEHLLGTLLRSDPQKTQLDTIRALASNGFHMKVTAAALDIHPHTLSYRVKQLRRRFDLDLQDPETQLRVQLALVIADAQRERSAGEGMD